MAFIQLSAQPVTVFKLENRCLPFKRIDSIGALNLCKLSLSHRVTWPLGTSRYFRSQLYINDRYTFFLKHVLTRMCKYDYLERGWPLNGGMSSSGSLAFPLDWCSTPVGLRAQENSDTFCNRLGLQVNYSVLQLVELCLGIWKMQIFGLCWTSMVVSSQAMIRKYASSILDIANCFLMVNLCWGSAFATHFLIVTNANTWLYVQFLYIENDWIYVVPFAQKIATLGIDDFGFWYSMTMTPYRGLM